MAAQNGAVVVVPYYAAEFEEDFESGVGLWTTSGSWEIGAPTSGPNSGYESTNCAATNLNGSYSNYADDWLISTTISLGTATEIKLYFWEWFSIESGYDYGRVKISTDGGSIWTEVSSRSGSSNWRETMIDLTTYQNESIQLAFHFTSDYSVTYSGWYIDDICVELEEPEPLTATMISLNSQNFPFIYMNVAVDTFGVGFPDLEQSNFQVYENGTLQTDYFDVTPPETGGGSRRADIVFLMDNSGSMSGEINAVSNNVLDFVDNLVAAGIDFALGLCRYGQSAYGGNPIIEDNGILTNDSNYFKYDVWARNYASGGTEPGYYAIVQSANSFSFRPGAQKIFIIITDETPDQGGASEIDALNTCVNNSITLFALTESGLYDDFSSITSATNGAYFNIYSNFDEILDYISSQVANTYVVRYYSSNPIFNGTIRNVEVVVNYDGNQATTSGTYIPGDAPQIERTQATLDLHNQPWAEGTEFTIEVEITDEIEPYTESAILYYKNTTESVYQYVSMYQTGKGEIWQGIIPGSDVETPGLDYYITATDGQTTSSDPSVDPMNNPYQFAILPNEAPVITHNPVTTLTINTPITISAEITDITNELAYAGLFYRKTGQLTYQEVEMTNTYGNTYEAEITADYVTADGVDYYIKAEDNFGVGSYHGLPDAPNFIEPEYDLGFRPNPDGWQFPNSEPNMWPSSWWQQFNYTQPPYPIGWPFWPI
ncbi:MAG: choice-of-anchor J domain-containing protein, partial [Candidatus Cloacimonetes bacterium]|nr:choice-of-anchor J domain-containing protein [Candidatus Cloacimonadota bacterium]